ncbi:MAG: pyridoxal phosphate-dependent aminotransferase [Clostridiaceae bacterium]|nr:pyridoxal phosphate-dependent aminotransferase [Clostridiaceae bacterium]
MNNNFFTKENDRYGSGSSKWDLFEANGYPQDTIPMWVADMDFPTVPEVIAEIEKLARTGIWGYTYASDAYYQAVVNWQKTRHNHLIKKEDISIMPGVVTAINVAIEAFTDVGDYVLIQEPVYHPFRIQIENLGRQAISADLIENQGQYKMDLATLEEMIVKHNIKLMLFCNPHNPVGRVYTRDELIDLSEILLKYNVLVVSDEIHGDLILPGYKHIPYATLSSETANQCITCTAPSKTFNLAGLTTSNIIIENTELKERFDRVAQKRALPALSPFGLKACETAYNCGAYWLDQLRTFIASQYQISKIFVETNQLPIKITPLEGTYLMWLDFRALTNNPDSIEAAGKNVGLWLNNGKIFGDSGRGFMRLNLACTEKTLNQGLVKITKMVEELAKTK